MLRIRAALPRLVAGVGFLGLGSCGFDDSAPSLRSFVVHNELQYRDVAVIYISGDPKSGDTVFADTVRSYQVSPEISYDPSKRQYLFFRYGPNRDSTRRNPFIPPTGECFVDSGSVWCIAGDCRETPFKLQKDDGEPAQVFVRLKNCVKVPEVCKPSGECREIPYSRQYTVY